MKIIQLLGYSGTLKSTITERLELPNVSNSNVDYLDLKQYVMVNKEFDRVRTITTSWELLYNHSRNISELLKDNSHTDVVINRSLTDYVFWNYSIDYDDPMDLDQVIKFELKLLEGYEVRRILLINNSDFIKSRLSEKQTRDMTSYDELQDKYVDFMRSIYPNIIEVNITDHNYEQVPNLVYNIVMNDVTITKE